MRIETQVLAIGIRMDVIVANTDELGIKSRGESRRTLDSAAGHGLQSCWIVSGNGLVRRKGRVGGCLRRPAGCSAEMRCLKEFSQFS